MGIVDTIAARLTDGVPHSPEVIAHCEAAIERECGPGAAEELREAGHELLHELLAEQAGDHRYDGNLRRCAEAWAEEWGLE